MRVLIASPDRFLLRHLTWLLSSFGYDVQTTADVETATTRLSVLQPGILLLDHAPVASLLSALEAAGRCGAFCYKFVVYGDASKLTVPELVEAGCDDFLRKPISPAEVLARLRVAARAIEYERRLETVRRRDSTTGFLTRRSLVEWRDEDDGQRGGKPTSLVVCECDALEPFRAAYGDLAAQLRSFLLADAIRDCCQADQAPVKLDANRYGVILPDQEVESARQWGGRLRDRFAALQSELPEPMPGLTASCAVVAWEAGQRSADVLEVALTTLRFARDNGGDCCIAAGQFAAERDEWLQSFNRGNPFAGSKARDLMTPFTLRLAATDTLGEAAARFRRTRLEILPVYDVDGGFLGIIREEECVPTADVAAETAATVSSLITKDAISIDGDEDVAAVMEHFFGLHDEPLVVTCRGEPGGTISHRGFAALVRPVTSRTFSLIEDDPKSPITRLIIPDTLEADDAAADDAAHDSAVNRFSMRIQTLGLGVPLGGRP